MKINEILNVLEEYAPLDLSKQFCERYKLYDNSGLILNTDADIEKIVFALDLSEKAYQLAIEKGAKLIVTHHPAIYDPETTLSNEEYIKTLDENNLIKKCERENIGIISFHMNLDVAKKGIDYYLASGLGGLEQRILEPLSVGIGYGRKYYNVKYLGGIVMQYKKMFKSDKIVVYGDYNQKINSICSFCGAGLNQNELELISGADLVISSDCKHHIIKEVINQGKCLMIVTHYSSEMFGFTKFKESIELSLKTKVECFLSEEPSLY